jgi:signal transduction histidine kinase
MEHIICVTHSHIETVQRLDHVVGKLVVRVVDRGAGFTVADATGGAGINESIHARMREIGGVAVVESSVGTGTCVELRWPA